MAIVSKAPSSLCCWLDPAALASLSAASAVTIAGVMVGLRYLRLRVVHCDGWPDCSGIGLGGTKIGSLRGRERDQAAGLPLGEFWVQLPVRGSALGVERGKRVESLRDRKIEGEGRGGLLVFRRRDYRALTEFGAALPGATGAVSPVRAPPSSVRAVDAMAEAPAGPPRKVITRLGVTAEVATLHVVS